MPVSRTRYHDSAIADAGRTASAGSLRPAFGVTAFAAGRTESCTAVLHSAAVGIEVTDSESHVGWPAVHIGAVELASLSARWNVHKKAVWAVWCYPVAVVVVQVVIVVSHFDVGAALFQWAVHHHWTTMILPMAHCQYEHQLRHQFDTSRHQ